MTRGKKPERICCCKCGVELSLRELAMCHHPEGHMCAVCYRDKIRADDLKYEQSGNEG